MTPEQSIIDTAEAVTANAEAADEIINKYSATRKVTRIPKVVLALLRLALYEMDCADKTEVPDKVAINEAVRLCKKYADEKDSRFMGGILGNYYRVSRQIDEDKFE
jgi:N utilization substance protein B